MTAAPRPLPVPDELSAPYWEAAARHVLSIARCSRCESYVIPPGQACPHCHATDPMFAFEPVSGQGKVRSWTVMRQSFLPGFAEEVPFVLVDVELAEQDELRLIGRLLDGPDAALHVGDRVTVAFEDVAPGVSVPAFVLGSDA
ncbi:OB-fold domain-containing protein [Actinomadura vinacea]|uniref:OB-fold domain-containing protein n=1 Tax=Actinomadura vinacea TaxID=115336 RepID=A0ABN3K3Q0_9ACTN